jgi:hypothetical protein
MLKNKYTIIRLILGVLILILTINVLIGNVDSKVIMPYMLTCLGIFQIFNGLHFYNQCKKPDGILLILSSIFIFGVVIKVSFFF